MSRSRLLLLGALLVCSLPLAAQDVASSAPQAWQADAHANKQAQKAAEKAAKRGVPAGGRREGGAPDGKGPPSGEGGPPGGGMGGGGPGGEGGGPPDGGKGGPHGGGKGKPEGGAVGRITSAVMLRPELDFAAPLKGTLLLYRTRSAVVFGTTGSDATVILPLSGELVEIAPGTWASVHDKDGVLQLQAATSNGIHSTFDYRQQADALVVSVHVEGPFPREHSHFDVERRYQRAPAGH